MGITMDGEQTGENQHASQDSSLTNDLFLAEYIWGVIDIQRKDLIHYKVTLVVMEDFEYIARLFTDAEREERQVLEKCDQTDPRCGAKRAMIESAVSYHRQYRIIVEDQLRSIIKKQKLNALFTVVAHGDETVGKLSFEKSCY